jgi:hypothetical protein
MKKLVIIPGGFHPFHAGHMALYNAAREAFPSAEIYAAATKDTSNRPFPFAIKEKLAQLSGIPPHRFIQVKSPFRVEEITQHFDPNDTQLIFVRSEKDVGTQPQPGGTKKDGSPSYLQPYKRNGLQPMSQHGYMAYLPVVQFGPGMTSATEIRAKWPDMEADAKADLVNQLYPATVGNDPLTNVTIKLLDQGMGIKDVAENFGGGGLQGAPIGGAMPMKTLKMPNGPDQEPKANRPGFSEATLVNNPESGIEIRPTGGLGTWTEDTLKSSLAQQLMQVVEALKSGNYKGAEHLLYKGGVVQSKVQALARLEDFNQRQGRRPIAKGREIDIGETTDYADES